MSKHDRDRNEHQSLEEQLESNGVHVHLHFNSGLAETQYQHLLANYRHTQEQLLALKNQIALEGTQIMTKLDDNFKQLVLDVEAEETTGESALVLLQGLVDAQKNATTPEQVAELSKKIVAFKQKFADAITANTNTPPPAALTANPSSVSLAIGGAQQVVLTDAQGNAASGVSAVSTDDTLATAGTDGTITGVAAGSGSVKFTDANGASVDVPFSVS